MVKRFADYGLPFLGYFLLTGLYTYPWSLHLQTQLPAGGDSLVFVWWFSHLRGALLGKHGLFYSDYIYYPLSHVFLPAHISFPIAIIFMGVPFAFLWGDIFAFNICAYLSFVLTSYGTYLLVRYLTKNKWASFIAGCIPAFAPYHYVSFVLGQMEAMSIQWFPFILLFCFKFKDQPSRKNALGLGVFMALLTLTSPYFVFVLIVFLIFFGLWFRKEILSRSLLRRGSLAFLTSVVLASPYYIPILWHQLSARLGARNISEFDFYSSDLLSFFLPASFHPLFGSWVTQAYHELNISPINCYAGITVLLISSWALLSQRISITRFFGLLVVVFFILSLGSSLHIGRLRIHFGWDQGFLGVPPDTPLKWKGTTHPIVLPFYYLHKYVPFFSMLRYPTRFLTLLFLALAVLYGLGLSLWMQKLKSNFSAALWGMAALALLGFDYLHPQAPLYHQPVSQFYRSLGQDPADFAILPIPVSPHSEYHYFQVFHGKKMMIGYMSMPVLDFYRLVLQNPFLHAATNEEIPGKWYWWKPPHETPLDEAEIERTVKKLAAWKVRYLVYHPQLDPIRDKTIPQFFVEMAGEGKAVYQDESVIVLRPEDLLSFPEFRRNLGGRQGF